MGLNPRRRSGVQAGPLMPQAGVGVRVNNLAEYQGRLWVATDAGLFRTTADGDALEKVALPEDPERGADA